VLIDGQPIYQKLKPLTQKWELVGNKGRHGKWCIAEYFIPNGANVLFTARAHGKEPIMHEFIARDDLKVNFHGHSYGGEIKGWIVSI
jgi:hypothetical protein